jgi:hypothetical protein
LIASANQQHFSRYPVPNEGRIMIVIYAGWDAVDATLSRALFARDERQSLRTAKSCGPDAPTLASSSWEAKPFSGATVANKPVAGESAI